MSSRVFLMMSALVLLTAFSNHARAELAFTSTFEDGTLGPFVKSSNARYEGQQVSIKDGGLYLEEANKHYGVAAALETPFKAEDGSLTIQYEVTLTEGLSCGGAYVKLLAADDTLDVKTFDDKTPYAVMFGPDKCGSTDKVHFIVRQLNPKTLEWTEHHLTGANAPRAEANKKTHMYTAIISGADDGMEILIDGERKFKGTLTKSLDPPLEPPEEIDDPEDKKPEDWVDVAKIDDPDAKKPDDWDEDAPREIEDPDATKPEGWLDDEPQLIPDPDATRPEDWDDDEDGVWEAPEIANPKCKKAPGCGEWTKPKIANPAFKGKWSPPKIDNPAYKGKWAPRKIPNKAYFKPENPAKTLPAVGAIAVEIWTTNKGIKYDNFALGTNADDAKTFAEAFYAKKAAEEEAAERKKENKRLKKLEKKLKKGSIIAKLQKLFEDVSSAAKEQPVPFAVSGIVALFTLVAYFAFSSKSSSSKKQDETPAAASSEKGDDKPADAAQTGADDDDEDDDSKEENKREKPPKAE